MQNAAGKRLLLIINPVAGKYKSHKHFSKIINQFEKNGYNVEAMETQKHGDATEFAFKNAYNVDVVVCVGGDGTVNETVSGLAKSGFQGTFGYIPSGTTNYFAGCNHISSSIAKASQVITDGKTEAINIGQFDNDYFAFAAAFGIFADLTYSTSQKVKNFIGYPAYILEGMRRLPKLEPIKMRIVTQSRAYEGNYIFGIISNYSSVVDIVTKRKSKAPFSTECFEVILISKPKNSFEWAHIIKSLISGSYKSNLIEYFNTGYLKIETQESIAWTLDGEKEISKTEVQLKKVENAVKLTVPYNRKEKP